MKKIKVEKGGNTLKEEIIFFFETVCEVLNRVYFFEDEFLHRSRSGTYNFAEESILRKCGYTVNKQIGLGQKERQSILELLVDYDVVDKQKICNYLSFLINMRIENNIYSEAVEKWRKDMLHIGYYQVDNKPKVEVRSITKY